MNARIKMIASMVTFGSMGLLIRNIGLAASAAALIRGVVGAAFLLALFALTRKRFSRAAFLKNLPALALSGVALGANWIFLFEAYRHTTIAMATLSYYVAPTIVLALSPLVLKEKLSALRATCVLVALLGMALVSGVAGSGAPARPAGILLGLCAALCYAGFTLTNKFVRGLSSMEATIAQLGISAVVILPYALTTGALSGILLSVQDALLLLVLGVVHTGLAFWWYFASVRDLKAQTVAVLSYIDPVTAILLSTLFLRERMDAVQILGACLILGSALLSETVGRFGLRGSRRGLRSESREGQRLLTPLPAPALGHGGKRADPAKFESRGEG